MYSGSDKNFYSGLVVIPVGDGTYYSDYGEKCPEGCAWDGRCGTDEECSWSILDFGFWIAFFGIFIGIGSYAIYDTV